MSRYTEKPMARAAEHLASARYAEAAGAFRAVLRIDPSEFQAHFGLADALVARGQRPEAVEGLVGAAEACSGQDDHAAALTLYGKALSIEPGRLELHLDVAMAEAALGRMEAAQSRLENLAEVYMQAGRTDEAAEVYRCLAGWEDDGEDEAQDEEVELQPTPARVTYVPTAPAESVPSHAVPSHAVPSHAVPQMVTSNETVVISTILVTPDGQLMQLPLDRPYGQSRPQKTGDTVPPIPAELLEAAHSAPIDLAEGEELGDVDRTVVAFPPPPPTLPVEYESAAHPIDRSELEAAVVAAMDNLAQLEEEDMTLIMQRLPPQPRVQTPRTRTGETRLPGFLIKSKPAAAPAPAPAPAPEETAADGKLRLRPAPRPAVAPKPGLAKPVVATGSRAGVAKAVSKGVAPSPGRAAPAKALGGGAPKPGPTARAKPAPSPARRGAAPAGRAVGAGPAASPGRAGSGAKAKAGVVPGARVGAQPRPPAESGAKPSAGSESSAPKATRPNNPLADRLRRRAGLPRPDAAAPGRPAPLRATEPITVRRGNPPKK